MALNILRLEFENYRNLCPGVIEPCSGVNIIYGRNAQGKTNLLEAMWLFTGGRSFRGSKDAELIAFEREQAGVNMDFYSGEREQRAEIVIQNGRRSATLNGVQKKSAAALVGTFCGVIFSPEHLSLVKEGPALRRTFIDSALCQIRPAYAPLLSRYTHILTQRNALLKDIPRHGELLDTLDIWDEKLAAYGEAIAKERAQYVEALSGPVTEIYAGISGAAGAGSGHTERIAAKYLPSSENLQEALHKARREDVFCGHTTAGPHRDDLEITIGGLSARAFGSQGQQRSLVLALKLAEALVLEQKIGERPVIFLDDVMSELDSSRQDYLLNHLDDRQVFITCCELDAVRRLQDGARFEMRKGAVHVSSSGAGHSD